MPNTIRVLIVSASDDTMHEANLALATSHVPILTRRVGDLESLHAALKQQPWDVIVCECILEGFTAYHALTAVKSHGIQPPFFVISDNAPEAVVTSALRAGATEYLPRDEMKRLGPAVLREVREREARSGGGGRAERALRRAEELAARLDRVLDSLSDEIYIFDSVTLHFIQVNQHARRDLGYTTHELRDLTPLDLKPGISHDSLLACLEPLRSGERDQVVLQTMHRRKDGSLYPVEVRLHYSRTESPPVFVEIATDITERRRHETALRESEERYRLLVEGVRDYAIFAVSSKGDVEAWNAGAERLLGYTAKEIVGSPVSLLYTPDDRLRAIPKADLEAAMRTGGHETEGWRVPKQGAAFWAHTVTTPLRGPDGPRGYSVLLRDLTERRRTLEELEASRRQVAVAEKLSALGTLVSGVAHEIRTPLTYMVNNLYLINHRLTAEVAARPDLAEFARDLEAYARAAEDGADRINHLVQNLRQAARIDHGGRARAGLNEVVAVAVELFRATHRGRVAVSSDLSPTPPLPLSREQIQQVVLNLLGNASEAMPQGGDVHVATRPAPGGAELIVRDGGPGIPPDVQARMFDPFFTTKAEGTGLGLSITKRIVEAHGGTIHYDTHPGRGTTFTLFLPDEG